MNILYITSDNLESPCCGSAIRSKNIYDALCQLGDVTIYSPEKHPKENVIEIAFRKFAKIVRYPFGPSPILQNSKINHKNFDAIVCRYIMNASATRPWKVAPCFIDIDDDPIMAFDNVEAKSLPCFLRPIGHLLVKLCSSYCLHRCRGYWTIDELPNIACMPSKDYFKYKPETNGKQYLLSVGLMSYSPNAEGVEWFLEQIWPTVQIEFPNLIWKIVGRGMSEELKTKCLKAHNIEVLGFVDNLEPLYRGAIAVVAPVLSGAGTCIKVREAALYGKIVLGTKVAFRGCPEIIILDNILLILRPVLIQLERYNHYLNKNILFINLLLILLLNL